MHFKVKIGLILSIFLLISTSLVSSLIPGRATKYVSNLEEKVGATNEETLYREDEEEENDIIHERVLRANTKDYGRYDPAPSLVRPHFKLIPN